MTGSSRLRPKSCVVEAEYVVLGAAWGAPIAAVEVRIDNGPWMPATSLAPSHAEEGVAWLCLAILDVRLGDTRARRAQGHVAGIRRRWQHATGAERSLPRQQENILGEQRTHHAPRAHPVIAGNRRPPLGERVPGGDALVSSG